MDNLNSVEITSVNNEVVKLAAKFQQKKYRDEEKKFLVEGFKPINEAFLAGIEIEQLFILKEKADKYSFLQNQPDCQIILTTEPVLKKISSTDSAPEAVAVAKQRIFTLDDIKDAKKVTLLENIKDLGNLGTILRTAKAFSQDAIILYGETVDFYNPKCVRSAVGNLWKIPVVQIKDFATLNAKFGAFERVATLPKSSDSVYLNDFKATSPYLIMFGSEADGLSDELIDFATKKVTIEMDSEVESLNLSISVGVLLYKLAN
jgi:TrmH family RNA methyltransferase